MADFFFYGTLCHLPLLATVLGRTPASRPCHLEDHAVYWAKGESFPLIVEEPGARAEGLLVEGLDDADAARLDFYEGGFAYHTRHVRVSPDGRAVSAATYFPDPGHWTPGAPWVLADWVSTWGEVVVATAGDFMALYGHAPSAEVLARYPMMLLRGASRVRAGVPAPRDLARSAAPGDVVVHRFTQPYAHFFALEEYDLSFRRFDGSMSPVVNRAVFVSGDAVTVLPYDPGRDRVMVIEQFRAAPFARGDAQPWQIEAIAGRIDPGETPEAAARREAVEEAGLDMAALLPVAGYYPSPGAKTEYLYSYVGLADLPDTAAGLGGVAHEAEDIRSHVIAFERLMELIATGEVANAPLILTALWLDRQRPGLRAGAATRGGA